MGEDKPALMADALGLPRGCMTTEEFGNGIPPAYSRFIGYAAMKARTAGAFEGAA